MKYVCDVCGWEYDEALGYPEAGIAPGTKWEDIPEDFASRLSSVATYILSEAYTSEKTETPKKHYALCLFRYFFRYSTTE